MQVVELVIWAVVVVSGQQPVVVSDQQIYEYAARAAGEAGFSAEAHAAVVCTMRNRIIAGWSPARVLSAYYAPDVTPTPAQVAMARAIFEGGCDPRFYFALGGIDTWRPHDRPAVAVIRDPYSDKSVWLFDK